MWHSGPSATDSLLIPTSHWGSSLSLAQSWLLLHLEKTRYETHLSVSSLPPRKWLSSAIIDARFKRAQCHPPGSTLVQLSPGWLHPLGLRDEQEPVPRKLITALWVLQPYAATPVLGLKKAYTGPHLLWLPLILWPGFILFRLSPESFWSALNTWFWLNTTNQTAQMMLPGATVQLLRDEASHW